MSYDELKWRFKPSAGELFTLVCGSVLLLRYAWILDDAYVYFRYVDNFVIHGQGLVWNPDEYVEGFSSPLWMLILSLLRATHLDFWVIILFTGVLCFIGFWWLACLVNRRLSGNFHSQNITLNIPLFYLAFTYGVSCYFTSGLESPLVNFIAVAYAAAILWPQSIVLQILVGLSPLVRHELALPYLLFLAYSRFMKRKTPWFAIFASMLTLLPYEIFRVWYYADFLPNTFYLKNITWPTQGLKYLYDTIVPYQVLPYFIGMTAVFLVRCRDRGCSAIMGTERLFMLLLSLPVALYVIKIGGDPRHFRYLAFPFILSVLATGGLVEQISPRSKSSRAFILAFIAIAAISNYPRQLQLPPLFGSPPHNYKSFFLITDAVLHKKSSCNFMPSELLSGSDLSYHEAKERYAKEYRLTKNRIAGNIYLSILNPNVYEKLDIYELHDPVIVSAWCRVSYMHAAFPSIHSLGLTDAFLARTQMPSDRPAHKLGLISLAHDILHMRMIYGFRKESFDHVIAENLSTPEWITDNIVTLRMIEQKVYNKHRFFENIMYALHHIPKIQPQVEKAQSESRLLVAHGF